MDTSPRFLTSSLQKYPFPSNGWKPRSNDVVIQEIIRDRRAAIEGGRLKGRRRLFSALEGGGELGSQRNERFSACSSVMIHESEVTSFCYNYSSSPDDEDEDEDGSCACVENAEMDKMVGLEEKGAVGVGFVDGRWWMVRIVWMAVGFVVFAFVIISAKSSAGREDGERLIPT